MRATSLLRVLLALQQTRVLGFEFNDDALVVDVAPTWRVPRCGNCGCKVGGSYDARERSWRHLGVAGIKLHLRYKLRRVACEACGVVVERVPWAEPGSGFTLPMETFVAYLAKRTDRTTITELARIGWRTVGRILRRYIKRHRDATGDPLDGLRFIGVDELSYRRHHKYVTTVVDHERGVVVWAAEGKNAETLKAFFKALGPERCAKLEAVTIDMSGAYIKAVTEASPEAQLIFDRFHVQRLAHDALDEVRREEVRKASASDKAALKKTRWPLQKNPWDLTRFEQDKLAMLEQRNQPIYRAYAQGEPARHSRSPPGQRRICQAGRVVGLGPQFQAPALRSPCRHLVEYEVAAQFFQAVVGQARRKRLISSEHFSVAGTLIEASASMKSFRPKDVDGDGDGNAWGEFRSAKRSNDAHASKTDLEARLPRKGRGREAKLAFGLNALKLREPGDGNGLLVGVCLDVATGTVGRDAVLAMLEDGPGGQRRGPLGAERD